MNKRTAFLALLVGVAFNFATSSQGLTNPRVLAAEQRDLQTPSARVHVMQSQPRATASMQPF